MPRRNQELDPELAAVKARIDAVKKRHKVRWTISPQTAEMAIAAFAGSRRKEREAPRAKSRRRKRSKRLL